MLENVEELAAIAQSSGSDEEWAMFHFLKGNALFGLKRYKEARSELNVRIKREFLRT